MGKRAKSKHAVVAETFTATPPQLSISDPAFAEFLRMSGIQTREINEQRAAGLSAYWRAQSIIAGTIAGLPLKVYRDTESVRDDVPDHWLSNKPVGPYDISPFSWVETMVLHLLNYGNAYLKHIRNGALEVVGLYPIHPLAVTKVVWKGSDKEFTVSTIAGPDEVLDSTEITQVMGLTTDNLMGMAPLQVFRQTLSTTYAGEVAANRSFTSGSLIAGLVSTEEDVDEDEAKDIAASLKQKIKGPESAGDIAFVNRQLKFTPWMATNKDAEFLLSRAFQVEEVARIFGIPTSLLSVSGAVSNWGTGVAEANAGLHRYVLATWTSRIESAINRLIKPLFCEFEFAGLLQGTPKDEIELLIAQVQAGLLTPNEARAIRNLPPLPKPKPVPVSIAPAAAMTPPADMQPPAQGVN